MGAIVFLFVNSTKALYLKAKDSEIKKYPLWLGNISEDFTANNIKKGLNGYVEWMNFLLIIILLILVILSIFINI